MQAGEHPFDPEELNEYLDGELPPDRAAVVQAHVAGCASCQKLTADLQGVSRDLAAWTIEKAPTHLQARRILDANPARRSWRPRWLMSVPALPALGLGAGALVLVLVGFSQLNRMSSENVMRFQLGGKVPAASAAPIAVPETRSSSERLEPAGLPATTPFGGTQAQVSTEVATPASHVIRTAMLRLIPKDFDASRAMLDRIVASTGGLLGDVNVTGVRTEARTLKATVRVPATQFDKMLTELKGLGDVTSETMSANDVTGQVIDLEARLANARNTEQRMRELLRTRTGKLSDVLEAEREVSRVREEIERLDAQRKNIAGQVAYGTITLSMEEAPKSSLTLGPLPLSLRLRNAFMDGFRAAFESAISAVLFFLQAGPFAILWLLVLGIPIRLFWRRFAGA